ncbi:RING-H2 finger protein ATL7 [Zea mays]|uniref:RING-H2 finger protein ATL7 n=1 Tax=Zea mays TaxID=4577 RepID=A0A1D6E2E6_MAIZE|nr:RING-H2 finger protein ATL7 [Zea mays]
MFGSGLNLVSAALGFGMTAAFAAFVCVRFICCRERRGDTRAPPSPDFAAELDGPRLERTFEGELRREGEGSCGQDVAGEMIERTRTGLEPLVIAAIPTMKYNCEAFNSKDDVQ